MRILGVESDRCTGCRACAVECPANLYSYSEYKTAVFSDPNNWCTGCGHCIAVCPMDAVKYDGDERANRLVEPLPESNAVLNLLQSKRSIRAYRPDVVSREDIATVLNAMRCAPSGHNAQPCAYLVITDEAQKTLLRDTTVLMLKKFRMLMRFYRLMRPFVNKQLYGIMSDPGVALGIEDMANRHEAGEDPIFFNAPVVIAVHVPDRGGESFIDPSIAFTYGMLAGHAIGLGSCWMGFTIMAVVRNKKILRRFNVPAGRMMAGVMTLGYPVSTFQRIPVRNKLNVSWQ
ncbi:MAG: nitroreductase family protein [Chitinispirillaceae bacterium]|nr:nitroreductase family protein [Chitinispirillaceae bacterium]